MEDNNEELFIVDNLEEFKLCNLYIGKLNKLLEIDESTLILIKSHLTHDEIQKEINNYKVSKKLENNEFTDLKICSSQDDFRSFYLNKNFFDLNFNSYREEKENLPSLIEFVLKDGDIINEANLNIDDVLIEIYHSIIYDDKQYIVCVFETQTLLLEINEKNEYKYICHSRYRKNQEYKYYINFKLYFDNGVKLLLNNVETDFNDFISNFYTYLNNNKIDVAKLLFDNLFFPNNSDMEKSEPLYSLKEKIRNRFVNGKYSDFLKNIKYINNKIETNQVLKPFETKVQAGYGKTLLGSMENQDPRFMEMINNTEKMIYDKFEDKKTLLLYGKQRPAIIFYRDKLEKLLDDVLKNDNVLVATLPIFKYSDGFTDRTYAIDLEYTELDKLIELINNNILLAIYDYKYNGKTDSFSFRIKELNKS